jgi:hypothetical protein
MNKHFLFSAILYLTAFALHAQIVITSVDMPEPGDTIRKSNTVVLEGIDYLPGGPDQVWLFNQLTVASQQVDTFISVGETPSIYQIFFNNQFIYPDYKATVAQKMATFNAIPGLTLTDSYLFIKNTTEEIRDAGYGVTLDVCPSRSSSSRSTRHTVSPWNTEMLILPIPCLKSVFLIWATCSVQNSGRTR